jgi:hypothetical protein
LRYYADKLKPRDERELALHLIQALHHLKVGMVHAGRFDFDYDLAGLRRRKREFFDSQGLRRSERTA